MLMPAYQRLFYTSKGPVGALGAAIFVGALSKFIIIVIIYPSMSPLLCDHP